MGSIRRILSVATVIHIVPYGRTWIWKKSRDPLDPFPSAIDVGPNKTGFFEDEIEAWLAALPRRGASPAEPENGGGAEGQNTEAANALTKPDENKPSDVPEAPAPEAATA